MENVSVVDGIDIYLDIYIFLTLGLKNGRLELKGSLLVSDMSELKMDNDPGAE